MISHALTILVNEMETHFTAYGAGSTTKVELGNLAEGFKTGTGPGVNRDVINLSVVNIKEEKALKQEPNYRRDDSQMKIIYENPPVFLNFQILVVATHSIYANALLALSRAIRFFQHRNCLTHENVAPASLVTNQPINPLDRLVEFKLIFDLHSPTMEEVNHLWGTLGGKQYPFVLYMMRMLGLKFDAIDGESEMIREITRNFSHKPAIS